MAADWIKMRVNLIDDPAVEGIADVTKLDRFGVIGRLHSLWSWADQQSRDGHVAHVTTVTVDKRTECAGFAEAMVKVGWLTVLSTGISFPNFDRHNGKPAKDRALAKNRQADKRSRSARDNTVTREEKSSSSNKHPTVTTGTRTSAQPPRRSTPVEKPSTPNPSHASTGPVTEPPLQAPNGADRGDQAPIPESVRAAVKANAARTPRKPRDRFNGHEPTVQDQMRDPEWWETPAGIQREGRNRGITPRAEDEGFEDFVARVYLAVGEGPWMQQANDRVRERIEHWRLVGPSA